MSCTHVSLFSNITLIFLFVNLCNVFLRCVLISRCGSVLCRSNGRTLTWCDWSFVFYPKWNSSHHDMLIFLAEVLGCCIKWPPDKSYEALLAFPDCAVLFPTVASTPESESLWWKHVHWPGSHIHSQATAAAAALHLLGNADLGHLHFKLVTHTHTHTYTLDRKTQKIEIQVRYDKEKKGRGLDVYCAATFTTQKSLNVTFHSKTIICVSIIHT